MHRIAAEHAITGGEGAESCLAYLPCFPARRANANGQLKLKDRDVIAVCAAWA